MRRKIMFLPVVFLCVVTAVPAATHRAVRSGIADRQTPPRLLAMTGRISLAAGKAPAGPVGVTFAIYKDQEGGEPLWIETQDVDVDESGRFAVVLGAASEGGVPLEIFTSGEARWLGFTQIPQVEQPRILLASVAYALKAADAETLGGKPLSAFVLSDPKSKDTKLKPVVNGTAGYIPQFIDTTNIDNSVLYQSAGRIGLGTTSPQAPLHINSVTTYRNGAVGSVQTGAYPGIMLENLATNSTVLLSEAFGFNVLTSPSATAPMSGADLRFVVRPTGNVGIGVNNPLASLHIGNPRLYRNLFVAAIQSGNSPGLMLENTTGNSTVALTENGGLFVYEKASSTAGFLGSDLKFAIKTDGGLVSIGTLGAGTAPAQGSGTRMMWYPGKGAFRAGTATGLEWDDGNVGRWSFASGRQNLVSGESSFTAGESNSVDVNYGGAVGYNNLVTASGTNGFAAGVDNFVRGNSGIALGISNLASGSNGIAIGDANAACGVSSIALGHAAVSASAAPMSNLCTGTAHNGAFVFSDSSDVTSYFLTTAANEFAARAAGGFRFRTSSDLTTGCNLPAGSGVFSCSSDRNLKENFRDLDGEEVLRKLGSMPIQTWSYKSERGGIRHAGPTAQDFRAAFGLGIDDKTIGQLDEAGVALRAVQALERQIVERDARIEDLEARLKKLERMLSGIKDAGPSHGASR